MGSNGVVYPLEHISHDTVQNWLDEFTTQAGICHSRGSFSTHCFRRGGAQYRFMHAPVGERWALHVVRYWGGWAEGEHVSNIFVPLSHHAYSHAPQHDTLMRYLLDELHTYEHDYSDALCPLPRDGRDSLLGERALVAPASTEEVRMFHASLASEVSTVKGEIVFCKSALAQIATAMNAFANLQAHQPIGRLSSIHFSTGTTSLTESIT